MKRISVQELGKLPSGAFDVGLFSASYEPRSLVSAQALNRAVARKYIVAWNANHADYNRTNFNKLVAICGEEQTIPCELNSDDPLKTADALFKALRLAKVKEGSRVLIDVTTFTREVLAITLRILTILMGRRASLTIVYNSAKNYDKDLEQPWLSRGIKEVRSVLGYAGALDPSRPSHLVVLPGFEHERAAELIASYEPRLLSIGTIPKEQSVSERFFELHQHFLNSLVALYNSENVRFFEFSACDALLTRDALLNQISTIKGYKPVIAPLNSKLATIGACLACFANEDIQLCYAQPERYNTTSFAEPSDKVYLCEIPFADM